MERDQVPAGRPADGTLTGSVATFDEAGGYGVIESTGPDAGTWFFHCTAIADGSRVITEGAPVQFEVVAGRLGRFEATNLRPAA